jgi:hypothetical protein
VRLVERHVADLAAVAPVPAKRGPLEAGRLAVDEEQAELERFGKAYLRQLGGG